MTKFQRLAKKLKPMFGDEPINFSRTYAGINMKKGGAFVWEAKLGVTTIGSTWTVTELLKAKNITAQHCGFNEIELFPECDLSLSNNLLKEPVFGHKKVTRV